MTKDNNESNVKSVQLSWGEQNAVGRKIAADAIEKCAVESNPTLLMREFEAHVATAGRGVMVGFFHEIAERQIRFG